MRFYVNSRINPLQKVYVRFNVPIAVHADIPYEPFIVTDLNGVQQFYYKHEVHAEVGNEPIGAALVVGALLFLIDPIIGVLGGLGSAALANQDEQERVRRFENS